MIVKKDSSILNVTSIFVDYMYIIDNQLAMIGFLFVFFS